MKNTKSQDSVLVIVIGLIALYWARKWNALLVAAFLIGLAAVLAPALGRWIDKGWMRLSQVLGAVSGKILLSLTYVLILMPLSFLSRALGRGGMRLKKGGTSYFKERNHVYGKEDLVDPW
jgi:hypothetical protein